MTVTPSIDPARLLEEQLAQASPDLLRELLTTFINTLMSAEADAVCGAAYGQASPDRTNRRNGYRGRDFDTRAGTLDLAVPKLRPAPTSRVALERRKRAERALTSVVATCYRLGHTRRRDSWSSPWDHHLVQSRSARWPRTSTPTWRSSALAARGRRPVHLRGRRALVLKVARRLVVGVHALGPPGHADGPERSSACSSPAARTAPAAGLLPRPDRRG